MEAKASRMSQKGFPAQAAAGAPTKVGKTLSKASITPSQMSERTRMNMASNKDPLDALSRSTMPPPHAERRSGLQDVDDEYLKTVVYGFSRQAGQNAAERSKVTAEMMPAGVPTARTPNQAFVNATDRAAAGANDSAQAGKAPAAAAAPQQTGGQMPPQAMQAQAQVQGQGQAQTQAQAQGQGQIPASQMQAQAPIQVPIQMQNAQPVQNAIPEKPQSPQDNAGQPRQGGSGCGDPELYTTCPNCQATLYLSRNAGEPSPYGNQGDVAQPLQ